MDNYVLIRHIFDAICRIEEYTKDMTNKDFIGNGLVQAGVIRELEIIGEAAKRITPEMKDKYPDIPWKKMAGARDKLIHQYFGVDIEVVALHSNVDTLPKHNNNAILCGYKNGLNPANHA
ncbi:MAG: DUF86 domain-containing protein [Nitrospirae bacterium]|nr:DUF86 domain-containing protein [Nitrospirota bacterium]